MEVAVGSPPLIVLMVSVNVKLRNCTSFILLLSRLWRKGVGCKTLLAVWCLMSHGRPRVESLRYHTHTFSPELQALVYISPSFNHCRVYLRHWVQKTVS